jgi:hypothetical protein
VVLQPRIRLCAGELLFSSSNRSCNRQIEARAADWRLIRIHHLAELQFTALMLHRSVSLLLLVCSTALAVQRYCITR